MSRNIMGASLPFAASQRGCKEEVIVICGPSSSGKSTFLRCINGLERMQSGDILVDGMSVTNQKTNMTKLRSKAAMVKCKKKGLINGGAIKNLKPNISCQYNILERKKEKGRFDLQMWLSGQVCFLRRGLISPISSMITG